MGGAVHRGSDTHDLRLQVVAGCESPDRTIDDKNPGGWVPAQKITVEEALRAYTVDAAYASFEEGLKGTITPGRLADVVMLERNIFDIPPEEIRDVRVAMTMVGGRTVYRGN